MNQPAAQSTSGVLGITLRTVAYRAIAGMSTAGVTVITARSLGPRGRGAFVLMFTVATVSYLGCSFGVNTAARVHLVARTKPVTPSEFLGLSAALACLETVVCTAVAALALPLVGVDLPLGLEMLTGLLGGTLLAQYMLFDAINAFGKTALASALDALGSAVQVVLVLVLAVLHVRALGPYIVALTVADVLQITTELVALRSMGISVRPTYSARAWRFLLRSGVPGTGLSLAQLLTFRLDRYLVGLFLTPQAVGLYSVAAAVPELLRIPCMALSNSFFYRIASGTAVAGDFRRMRRGSLGLTVLFSGVTFVLAPVGIRLVFGERYMGAVGALRVLLLAEVGVSVFQLDGFSLAGLNRIGRAATAAGLGLAVVTVADIVLIPHHGIVGASWASVIGYSVMGTVAYVFLRPHLRQPASPVAAPS